MRNISMLTGMVLLLALASGSATAQGYGNPYGDDNSQVIRCESQDGRWRQCNIGGNRDVQLLRQLSGSPCIQGRTWGLDGRGLWVTEGCRAEFRIDDGYGSGYGYGNEYGNGQSFRCESRDGRNRECPANANGDIRIVRQLSSSPCIQGQTWDRFRNGAYKNGVWVTGGCRAEFQVQPLRRNPWNRWRNQGGGYYGNGYSNQQALRCESRDERLSRCSANINRGVQLVRQYSQSPCIEGRSWGWDRNGVWVRNGCRAEFSVW